MNTLRTIATTSDGTAPPSGVPTTLASVKSSKDGGASIITRIFKGLHLTQTLLKNLTNFLLPTSQIWTDPFGGLLHLGQMLMVTSISAFGAAALLHSTTGSLLAAAGNLISFDPGGALATMVGHFIVQFLALPIFALLTAMLIPGLIITYVLPMIPFVLWMAGVAGWLILVCEAMIGVPLWMLAHMTFGGDGLHGRGIEGWGLIFNVIFRPTLMVVGLFLGYYVYDSMSWLIRESFGVAAGFALDGGWIVTNLIGLVVLLNIFVMLQVTAALMSFRLVSLLPHHLPRLIGLAPANRVDTEQFVQQAALGPGSDIAGGTRYAFSDSLAKNAERKNLPGRPTRAIAGPEGSGSDSTMDTTLRATTDPGGGGEENRDE